MSNFLPDITRTSPLLDFDIERSGDGRTVVAYAAAFGNPYEVNDHEGHYDEVLNPAAFNKVIARSGFLESVQVHFNHGLTLWGTPSDRYTMPVGVAREVKADAKGLLTRTEYAKTELGDEVLELWRTGAIRGQSFRGPVYPNSSRRTERGPNGRPVIERMQLGLREYGPTPNPANIQAGLVAIRSQLLSRSFAEMSPDERRELAALVAEVQQLGVIDPLSTLEADPAPVAHVDQEDAGMPIELLEMANAARRRRQTI